MRIAVTGGKGGTGESMVATSLAFEFAKNNKTMLVDADAECPNDHLLLSIKLKKEKNVYQMIPKWNYKKCNKCGVCAEACKQDSIIFVNGKYPAFVKDSCIGCRACVLSCPQKAITESKKVIGMLHYGKKYDINLISSELKLGELASGEVVAEVREYAEKKNNKIKAKVIIIDSAAGIGCPVIASLTSTDYIIAVTEPTPSALFDLKRVLYLAEHFKIPYGLIINKHDLEKSFCKKIEDYAEKKRIPILGRIPYSRDFIKSTIKMKPVTIINPEYEKIFKGISQNIYKFMNFNSFND